MIILESGSARLVELVELVESVELGIKEIIIFVYFRVFRRLLNWEDLANGFFRRDSFKLTFAMVGTVELVELVELVKLVELVELVELGIKEIIIFACFRVFRGLLNWLNWEDLANRVRLPAVAESSKLELLLNEYKRYFKINL